MIERFGGVGSRMICLLGLGVNHGGCGFARVEKYNGDGIMSKKSMWILVGAAFALNVVGLLWIRNEVVGPVAGIEEIGRASCRERV